MEDSQAENLLNDPLYVSLCQVKDTSLNTYNRLLTSGLSGTVLLRRTACMQLTLNKIYTQRHIHTVSPFYTTVTNQINVKKTIFKKKVTCDI